MAPIYTVANYPAEGQSLSWQDRQIREFRSLEEAREEVKRRLGDLNDWRIWPGTPDDNDVEAYHETIYDGCGGVAISTE